MYMPTHFKMEEEDALGVLEQQNFATLVSLGQGGLLSTPLPLLLDRSHGDIRLIGHVARANPHWKRFDPSVPSLAIFNAGDGYVAPAWYAAKAATGKVVPTWNYVTVHAHGRLEAVEDADGVLDIVTRLTNRHEGGRASPWKVSDAPADFIAANLRGIVGLVLHVERLEGKAKLSQNKDVADRATIRAGMEGVLAIP
ncbi:FMN-binding negative transcriptional regulator [Niveispirillum sp. KHB5.9]|uniref:FMN-binding negative transcriptional regulator n=1 Tax=Niveispirillum sp. KHB5.9 TaxID=3400269 RepID=UPI003A89EC9B